MSPISTCLITLSAIKGVISGELMTSSSISMNPKQTNMASENDQQLRTLLVEHLSDCIHLHQTVKTMTAKKEPTLILTHYHGMNLKT